MLFEKKSSENFNIIANAGFSLYHKPNKDMNQRQFRDFALALSFQGNAGRSPFLGEGESEMGLREEDKLDQSRITFSFTGRYQRLFENRGVANKRADIANAQFKLEIPFFTGVSLPFSVTYASATEERNKSHVRANFGLTLDADKIFQIKRFRNRNR
jgi:hypothetical protein